MENSEEKYEKIKNSFYEHAINILQKFPNEKEEFKKTWKSDYRKAYVFFTKFQLDKNIKLDEKVDSDFFWTFMH